MTVRGETRGAQSVAQICYPEARDEIRGYVALWAAVFREHLQASLGTDVWFPNERPEDVQAESDAWFLSDQFEMVCVLLDMDAGAVRAAWRRLRALAPNWDERSHQLARERAADPRRITARNLCAGIAQQAGRTLADLQGPSRKGDLAALRRQAVAELRAAGVPQTVIAETLAREESTIRQMVQTIARHRKGARA